MPKLHCFIVLLLLLFSGETYSQTTRNLQAPVLYMPQDKAVFTKDQVQAIIFRWRPVFPPTDDVTYHIRVFEVLPEQSPMQALRTNYPLVEEEVEQSFWIWTPDILLSDEEHQFVWQVQAFDASGFTLGEPDGLSSPFTFTVTKPALMDVSLKNYLLRNNFAATATNFDIVMKLNPEIFKDDSTFDFNDSTSNLDFSILVLPDFPRPPDSLLDIEMQNFEQGLISPEQIELFEKNETLLEQKIGQLSNDTSITLTKEALDSIADILDYLKKLREEEFPLSNMELEMINKEVQRLIRMLNEHSGDGAFNPKFSRYLEELYKIYIKTPADLKKEGKKKKPKENDDTGNRKYHNSDYWTASTVNIQASQDLSGHPRKATLLPAPPKPSVRILVHVNTVDENDVTDVLHNYEVYYCIQADSASFDEHTRIQKRSSPAAYAHLLLDRKYWFYAKKNGKIVSAWEQVSFSAFNPEVQDKIKAKKTSSFEANLYILKDD